MGHTIKIVIATVLILSAVSFGGTYSGGGGTETEPYQISNVANWQELMDTSDDWASYFILTADIDLDGITLMPVGNDSTQFAGVFDGHGHKIRNAIINQPSSDVIGLFGSIGSGGKIRNLGIEDVNITGYSSVGGLVGFIHGGTLTSCYATGSVNGDEEVGGLIGWNNGGNVSNSYSTCAVDGDQWVGGFIGYSDNNGNATSCYATGTVSGYEIVGGFVGSNGSPTSVASINSCYAVGNVSGSSDFIGGFVGNNSTESSINSCYAKGAVSGHDEVGGFAGYNSGQIVRCYSTGKPTGHSFVGGLCGVINSGSDITGNFWDTQTSGKSIGVGYGEETGVTGKTTAEMKMLATFTSAGWNFFNVWAIAQNQTYPYLRMSCFAMCPTADLTGDCFVGFEDFAVMAGQWLTEGIPASADTTPPEPNPMTFAVEPMAISDTEIIMTATTATDTGTPPVQYYFTNVTDPNHNSGWMSSPAFVDTDLTPETTYTYNVKTRDSAAPVPNQTAASADASATTGQSPDSTPPEPNPMTFAAEPAAISDSQITMTATTATDIHDVQYYFTNVTDSNHNSGWQDSPTFTDTGLEPETTYTYNVKARDKSIAHNVTAVSADASATTYADISAPTPDPMTWAIEPYAIGSSSIAMRATTASDTSGPVLYQFWRTTGTVAIVRAYNADANFIATGLTENTIYGYKVRAKDALGNETEFSSAKTAITGKTIQTLIDEALALRVGEEPVTVTIPAGTYTGDIVVNDPNVTLKSASGAAITVIQLVDGAGINIQGSADAFVLDGFTIQPDDTDTTFAIQLANGPVDVNIANNIIDVNSNAATMAICVYPAGTEGLTVIGNSIAIGSGDGGIWGPDVSNVLVCGNTISGPAEHITSGYAVQFAGITGDSFITGNTITNTNAGVFIYGASAGGGTTVAEGVTISNNTVSQCQRGIRLGHSSDTENMADVNVYDNTLQQNVIGVYVDTDGGALIDADTFIVKGNSFVGNITAGLQNNDADEVPAELNWWGAASGPYHTTNVGGLGDTIIGTVDFDPWYTSSAMDANSAD